MSESNITEKLLNLRIQQRYDTVERWENSKIILLLGEVAFDDSGLYKIGNGKDLWKDLPYGVDIETIENEILELQEKVGKSTDEISAEIESKINKEIEKREKVQSSLFGTTTDEDSTKTNINEPVSTISELTGGLLKELVTKSEETDTKFETSLFGTTVKTDDITGENIYPSTLDDITSDGTGLIAELKKQNADLSDVLYGEDVEPVTDVITTNESTDGLSKSVKVDGINGAIGDLANAIVANNTNQVNIIKKLFGSKAVTDNNFTDSTVLISSDVLPSYVDDVIEGYYVETTEAKTNEDGTTVTETTTKFYSDEAKTEEYTAEDGKIYVDVDTRKTYRWSGSQYIEISESLVLGTTSETAFRGDYGHDLQTYVYGDTKDGELSLNDSSEYDTSKGSIQERLVELEAFQAKVEALDTIYGGNAGDVTIPEVSTVSLPTNTTVETTEEKEEIKNTVIDAFNLTDTSSNNNVVTNTNTDNELESVTVTVDSNDDVVVPAGLTVSSYAGTNADGNAVTVANSISGNSVSIEG